MKHKKILSLLAVVMLASCGGLSEDEISKINKYIRKELVQTSYNFNNIDSINVYPTQFIEPRYLPSDVGKYFSLSWNFSDSNLFSSKKIGTTGIMYEPVYNELGCEEIQTSANVDVTCQDLKYSDTFDTTITLPKYYKFIKKEWENTAKREGILNEFKEPMSGSTTSVSLRSGEDGIDFSSSYTHDAVVTDHSYLTLNLSQATLTYSVKQIHGGLYGSTTKYEDTYVYYFGNTKKIVGLETNDVILDSSFNKSEHDFTIYDINKPFVEYHKHVAYCSFRIFNTMVKDKNDTKYITVI